MTTPEQRTELMELAAKATELPWEAEPVKYDNYVPDEFCFGEPPTPVAAAFITPFTLDCGDYMGLHDEDAAFIVAAANLAPELCAEVEALTAEVAALKEANRWRKYPGEKPNSSDEVLEAITDAGTILILGFEDHWFLADDEFADEIQRDVVYWRYWVEPPSNTREDYLQDL